LCVQPRADLGTGNFTGGWPSDEQTLGLAAHVHAEFRTVGPDGSAESVDYARIVPGLRAAGYDGWVSFEYEARSPRPPAFPGPWRS